MAKTRLQKEVLLKEYKNLVSGAKSIVLVRTSSLTPNEMSKFKKSISEFGAKVYVIKNNVFKIALKEADLAEVESLSFGEHAVLFTEEDIVSPSKQLKQLIEETKLKDDTKKVTIVAGFLDGNQLSVEQVIDLADMPSKEESISMILGILDQAAGSIVNVLEDAPRSVVTILDQAFSS